MTGRGIDQILRQPSNPTLHERYVNDARDYVALAEARLLRSQKKLARNTARAQLEPNPIPRRVAPEYIWGDALEIWRERKPDLKIANLETAITSSAEYAHKGINYRMHPENIDVLSAAGFDCLSLANNHVLDWGIAGLQDTIAALGRVGVKHSGAGASLEEAQAPAIFETPGGRVLVFSLGAASSGIPLDWAATENSPGVWLLRALNKDAVASVQKAVARHRQPGDTVIASIHWGSNWGYDIPDSQVRFARALIDECGVDIVPGHSSHHPRRYEIYNGRPIFNGCGDFINDYEGIGGQEEFRGDLVLMYFVDFDNQPFKLLNVETVAMQIHKFRLRRANEEAVLWMAKDDDLK